jgi:hypothetical protein
VGVIPDHVGDQFADLPALAAVAARTESLRLGPYMLNNERRHPAVLALELATVDQISDGRLEIGIGAGWNVLEYRWLGLEFDRPKVRHERLREAVQVIRGALSGETFSFEGDYYRIDAMVGQPLPVQRPCPPIAIGGGGRRTLEFAAATADIVGIAPRFSVEGKADFGSLVRDATQEQLEWLRSAAGSRFENIELTVFSQGPDPSTGSPLVSWCGGGGDMLENFTVDTFAPLVGDVFVVHVDTKNVLDLRLVEAVPIGGPDSSAAIQGRRPFSLSFRGPRTPVMVQRIYPIDHPTLGSFEVFLVPVGSDEHGMLYELVFN